ncbi:MAG: hypothetical protein IJS89_07405 [Bacteroidaceae bacterium]|nr:hypothetical protein [Bacteroidaceae bacterium]
MEQQSSKVMSFRVAGVVFTLDYNDADNPRRLIPSYKNFYLPDYAGHSDMRVRVAPGLVDDNPEGEEMGQFDTGGTVHGVYRLADGGYKFQLRSVDGEIAAAVRANSDFSSVEATLTENMKNRPFGLNNVLMICYAYCAAYHRVVLMHASVVTRDEKAYLFLGKSGTGKSTHTQLWIRHLRGSRLLNDDNPAVRVADDGSVTVYGTPWSGKTPCYHNESAPVGAFVRLEQWKENLISREPVITAFASVLSSCSSMMWDKPTYSRICDTCTAMVGSVPVYHLRNLPNEAAVRLSHDTISRPV